MRPKFFSRCLCTEENIALVVLPKIKQGVDIPKKSNDYHLTEFIHCLQSSKVSNYGNQMSINDGLLRIHLFLVIVIILLFWQIRLGLAG
jgi:hypothetical protein